MIPMRVAVITQTRHRVGGVESYIESVLPALASRHQVAFWSATAEAAPRGEIRLPEGVVALRGEKEDGLRALRAWKPDLLFAHGLEDEQAEAEMVRVAPTVFVEHTYHGTCISSAKTLSWPAVRQCQRPLGAACLALYLPRRCGGLNPVTAVRLYRVQSLRLEMLRRVAAVVTLSAYMRDEVVRNGVPREHVHVIRPFVATSGDAGESAPPRGRECRLLYLGRLEPLKGVRTLLESLRSVAARIDRPIRLVIAGEGTERDALERQAERLCHTDRRISVQFAGWQDGADKARLFEGSDALVVPSLWPEPFGLVGLEAAAAGLPAIAFATGGITEWLREGENGCLAPAGGGSAELLADAIVRCASDPERLARLAAGARRTAAEWSLDKHVAALQDVFRSVVPRMAVV